MSKRFVRRRPVIQTDNRYIEREEHVICQGEDCQNLVSVSTSQQLRGSGPIFCILCRKKQT